MITRQKILLSFIRQAGNEISLIKLVKCAFLLSEESKIKSIDTFYQFLPYKNGPFSFTLYQELNHLIKSGIVSPSEGRKIELVGDISGKEYLLDYQTESEILRVWNFYGKKTPWALVNYVYEKYPWYTLLAKAQDKRRVKYPQTTPAVYTCGYEGMQIDGFINILLKRGIKRLVDVRYNPLSRKYGFYKTTLAGICLMVGIQYVHVPELGIPPNLRRELKGFEDYEALFRQYEQTVLKNNHVALQKIVELVEDIPSVLVCQEANPNYCHRTTLAKRVAQLTDFDVIDLGEARWKSTSIPEQGCLLP